MSRPLIGLSTYREQARWGVWDQRADLLPTVYADAVEAAGGVPVLLPPTTPYDDAAAAAVARLDGLVISGGADVSPQRYDEDPHDRTTNWREDRDSWELALLGAADDAGLPVLGVCRGMQVMAVHAGGTLDQHVPDLVGHDRHNPAPGVFGDTSVSLAPESRLASLIGTTHTVHCHHHQSVRDAPRLHRGRLGRRRSPRGHGGDRRPAVRRRPVAPRGGRRRRPVPRPGRCRNVALTPQLPLPV